MANVENKTAAVPPVESQQAPTTVAVVTQSQAQAATGPAEVSVAVGQAEVLAGVTEKGLGRTLSPWAEKIKDWWEKRSSFEKEVIGFVVVPPLPSSGMCLCGLPPCTFPKRSLQSAPGQSNRCRLT